MSRVVFVNGRYLPYHCAAVHVEDRGYQFADGVYDVCEVWNEHIVELEWHLDRLYWALNWLRVPFKMDRAAVVHVFRRLIRLNLVKNGHVYIQVTRGVAQRDHSFPDKKIVPSVVVIARSGDSEKLCEMAERGIAVITTQEMRWRHVNLKTTSLLPNVLAKENARSVSAEEAWFVDQEGCVTEGSSSNSWIVNANGVLVTRPAEDGSILAGVTRKALIMRVTPALGLKVEERPFTVEEAKNAVEAFNTAAVIVIMPVISIDGSPVGNGLPGKVARALRNEFHKFAELTPVSGRTSRFYTASFGIAAE